MNLTLKLCWVLLTAMYSEARDEDTIGFIKGYMKNERNPTQLLFCNFCWNKYLKLKLVNAISEDGNRLSMKMEHNTSSQDHFILFVLDLNCPGAKEIIYKATPQLLFSFPFRWLVLHDPATADNYTYASMTALIEAPVLVDSDLVLAEKTSWGYKMTELHRIKSNLSLIFTPRGFYNSTIIDTRPNRELFSRRKNMMLQPITTSIVISDSNSSMYHIPREDRLEPQNDAIGKSNWMSTKLVLEMFNATPQIIFTFSYGYQHEGKWTGMISDLINDRADIGTNCYISKQRMEQLSFTDAVAPINLFFIFRQPPLSFETNIFALPFSINVWLSIVVSVIIFIFTMWLSAKWETRDGVSATQLATVGDSILLTSAAVAQQGCSLEPTKASGRLMLWIFFTACMALYAAFSANIVVLLQTPSNSIRTLEHLAKSKMTLAAFDVDYNHFVFKIFDDDARVEISKKILKEGSKDKPELYGLDEGIERVRQGLFAFLAISDPVYHKITNTFSEMEKCDLMEIDYVNLFDPVVPVKRNSPYLELVRIALKRLREAGLKQIIVKRVYPMKPSCSNKGSAFTSVGMQDFKPALVLILCGNLLAVTIAILETIVFKMEPQNDAIGKSNWMSAKLVFEMFNATPQVIFTFSFGYQHEGNWTGMISDLINDRADAVV